MPEPKVPRTASSRGVVSLREAALASAAHRDPPKRAEALAGQIEAEIITNGWAAGYWLGSEPELLERYGVSRQVMRETIRLLEHHMVARMRRGVSGGLVVTAPDPSTVATAAARYLDFQGVGPEHLHNSRSALELKAVELVMQRLGPAERARIEDQIGAEATFDPLTIAERGGDFHLLIAELTGDPALLLFVRVLAQMTSERSLPGVSEAPVRHLYQSRKEHASIARAMLDGDAALARSLMKRHLAWIERRQNLAMARAGSPHAGDRRAAPGTH